jgi:hypothetical protein
MFPLDHILFYLIAAGGICIGLIYLFSPKIMPYHQQFLGITHEQLPSNIAKLLLTLMRVAGSLFLALSFCILMLVRFGLQNGIDRWILWTILGAVLIFAIPTLYFTLRIGWYTPWWLVAVSIVLAIIGFILNENLFV